MQSKIIALQTDFTALTALQAAHTLEYQMITYDTSEGTQYGIYVMQTGGDCAQFDEIGPFTSNGERARQIMTYLCENAVPVAHCISVIADVCAVLEQPNWEKQYGAKDNSFVDCR